MDIEIKTWLYDILNAITEIDSFFKDQPKEKFWPTKMTQEREELSNEISKSLVRRQIAFFKKTTE